MPLAAIWSSVVVSSSAAGGGRNLADTQHTIYTGGTSGGTPHMGDRKYHDINRVS